MIIDKNSIIVDGVNFGQYLTDAKLTPQKLWSNKSGRQENLAGSMTGTLVGIFPKLEITFAPLTKNEIEIVAPILDKAFQTTTYYDPTKKQKLTIQTYAGDYSIGSKNIIDDLRKCEPIKVSLIATKRRV